MEKLQALSERSNLKPVRLGFLASRNGTDARYIIKAIQDSTLKETTVNAIATNNPDAAIIQFAKDNDFPIEVINKKLYANPSQAIFDFFHSKKVNLVICSGYMKSIGPELFERIPTLNVHPANPGKYGGKGMYGNIVHERVIQAGEIVTFPTIHIVNENYDEGPIISQEVVPVYPGIDTPETLKERVQPAEIRMYLDILQRLSAGELIEGFETQDIS